MTRVKIFSIIIICSVITGSIIWVFRPSDPVLAQLNQEIWTEPINLSRSGGTSNPAMVIDSGGGIHVIWYDAYLGTVYSEFVDGGWSAPRAVQLPFSPVILNPGETVQPGPSPTFITDQTGNIYAFWVDEQNRLFVSYVPSNDFGNPERWSIPSQIAESAMDFDVVIDDQGNVHLIYVRGLSGGGFPSGIYYRTSSDRGLSWASAQLLYESPYLRNVSSNNANVDITAASDQGTVLLFVAWDNRPRRQVYFTHSIDGGRSWEQYQLIESPNENNPNARPSNIKIVEHNANLLLFWQDGDSTVSCTQYYSVSSDGGKSWGNRQRMFVEISGCPQDIRFFTQNNLLIMMTTIQAQIYLSAWDGSQWSRLQPQRELMGFLDPDTFDQVIFDCRQAAKDAKGNLVVVGCDTGGGGDIWFTQRSIGDLSEWFPPPSAWTEPEVVTTTDTPITNPILLADSKGRLHAFWVQQVTSSATSSATTNIRDAIHYSRRENDQWTRPVAILQSPSGMTRQPAAAIDRNDNLYVVWSGGEGGEIYFSRASGERANLSSDWIQPLLLPSVRQLGSSPDIQVAGNGIIYVVYSIPLNEQRGIYVVKSADGGLSWTEPSLAFDAVQAGWEMIDRPRIEIGRSIIYIIFMRLTVPYVGGVNGLYAVYSSDGGRSWSDSKPIVEKPILWGGLTNAVGESLLRAWLEPTIGGNFFQYQISQDQGVTWSPADSISFTDNISGDPVLVKDPANQVYLVQGLSNIGGEVFIRQWKWDGVQWFLGEDLDLRSSAEIKDVTGAISPQGRIGMVYTGLTRGIVENSDAYFLEYSDRMIDLPTIMPTSQPETIIEPTLTQVAAETPLPIPTSTSPIPTISISELGEGTTSSENSWTGVVIGTMLAGLIGIVVFISRLVGIRQK